MIRLTQLSGRAIVINSDLIETVECTPDTIISLTTGKKIIVCESDQDVIDRATAFRCACAGREVMMSTVNAATDGTT